LSGRVGERYVIIHLRNKFGNRRVSIYFDDGGTCVDEVSAPSLKLARKAEAAGLAGF